MGLASARGLALALDIPVAGVSTLAALAAGAPDAVALIDAKRHELFLAQDGEIVARTCGRFRSAGANVCRRRSDPLPRAPRAHRCRRGAATFIFRALVSTHSSLETTSSRCTCACRTSIGAPHEDRSRHPRAHDRRSEHDRVDRAPVVRNAVVALDVRRRARQARLLVSRRVRGRQTRGLPDHVSLRRCVARDEHRRESRVSAPRDRDLERLFELTDDGGRRGYTLEVRVSNKGAIKLYERLGFTARGKRRGYYTDNREDALVMWRDPTDG